MLDPEVSLQLLVSLCSMLDDAPVACLTPPSYCWRKVRSLLIRAAKENSIGEQCRETEENLRKNNSKRAYQLVKDLSTVKQQKATTVQDRSGKCLTKGRHILNQWTEYCSELYSYKANGDPSVLNCPKTDTGDDHPILRREVRLQYNH